MTLYLAGKSDRDKIIFGSDGRVVSGSNDNLRVSGEDQAKFRFFQPNLVACFSGSAFLTFDIMK